MTHTRKIIVFRLATLFLFGVGILHPAIHFLARKPANDVEEKLFHFMDSYHKPIAGGVMTMMDVHDGLNICYGLFFLFVGSVNLYCLRHQRTNTSFIKGLCSIECGFFLIATGISVIYFFWVPVAYLFVLSICFAWIGQMRLK